MTACIALAYACHGLAAQQASANPPARLTLEQAERMAIQHNPNISVARLAALAQQQVTREVRSVELPTADVDLTAVDAHDNTRITAGQINNPSIYNRAAGGLRVSQLITDFGHTHQLVLSAKSSARAQADSERATEQEIRLAVDQAFNQALDARAVLGVALEAVDARQQTADEIKALVDSKLKSTLDLSFADVELSQAKMFLLDAQNSADAAMANLNEILGSETDDRYELVDETPDNAPAPPQNSEGLVRTAFQARPDLASMQEQSTAAKQMSSAEHDLWRPSVSGLAVVGGTPVRADQIDSSWYGAAGVNISVPVFNGFLFNARAKQADLNAAAARERVRNMRDVVARDVRTASLDARTSFQRIGVAQEMLNETKLSLDLANTRYRIGLSGIVELSQAQLAQTQAEVAFANARYAYQAALAIVRFETGQ